MELREKKIPFTVRRYLPDGRCATSNSLLAWLVVVHPVETHSCMRLRLQFSDTHFHCSYEDWSVQELIISER